MLGTDGLLAPGRHTVTAAEFKATFVEGFPDSSTRAALYTRWLRHRAAILGHVPILSQWIDGSFVTNKDDPGDIDVVTIMNESDFIALAPVAQSMLASLLAGKELGAQLVESVDELRQTEVARLNALQVVLWDRAMSGDLQAAKVSAGIIMARCRVLGLLATTSPEVKRASSNCGPRTLVISPTDCRHTGCPTHGSFD